MADLFNQPLTSSHTQAGENLSRPFGGVAGAARPLKPGDVHTVLLAKLREPHRHRTGRDAQSIGNVLHRPAGTLRLNNRREEKFKSDTLLTNLTTHSINLLHYTTLCCRLPNWLTVATSINRTKRQVSEFIPVYFWNVFRAIFVSSVETSSSSFCISFFLLASLLTFSAALTFTLLLN